MIEFFLYMFFFHDYRNAILESRKNNHEKSEEIFSKINSGESEYHFYRMINAYKLNKKEEGIKWANCILYSFTPVPIRYNDVAFILKAEMEQWKNERNDLEDISREMVKIKDRLSNEKGGKKTQEMQKDVLDRLDKMIKDLENSQSQAQAEKGKDGNKQPSNPAQEAISPTDKGTGEVDKKKVRELAEVWGKLPEKERAKAMVELTKNLPFKDKVVIQNYFKELLRKSSKR